MTNPLLDMLISKTRHRVPAPLKIRIPANHPRVDELVRIFNILASGMQTQSGIIVTGGGVSDEAVRIFLNELDIFLARDGIALESLMAPFLEHSKPDLDPAILMQAVLDATRAPALPRIQTAKSRGRG